MTIEIPLANRPTNRCTMFAQSPMFHDYAASPAVSEHSLQSDIHYTLSPNSLTMYEGDGEFLSGSFGSVCSETSFIDTGQPEEFDLKPQFECSDTKLLHLNIDLSSYDEINAGVGRGDPVWSPVEAGLLKMEDIFQVDQQDAVQGPTLAELNFDDSMSVFDDIETILQKEDRTQLGGGKCGLPWPVTANRQKMKLAACIPPKVTYAAKGTPAKFTTCTITSPAMTAPLDLTTGCQGSATGQATPMMYTVSGKFSLFQDTNANPPLTTVKTEPQASSPGVPSCLPINPPAIMTTPLSVPLPKVLQTTPIEIAPIPPKETKSSLHQLLTDTTVPVIKTEPKTPDVPCSPPAGSPWGNKGLKRALSPENVSNTSTNSMEQKWEEIKQFIHEHSSEETEPSQTQSPLPPLPPPPVAEEPVVRRKRVKSESKDVAFTVKDEVDSQDEGLDSDQDDSDEGDSIGDKDEGLSDAESLDSHCSLLDEGSSSAKGEPRYFWMYNTQSKGPKGKRLCKSMATIDPHILNDFEDPVFDPDLNQTQYKHNGKARRGDGNDITPSPQKLLSIGNELKKLNRTITDLAPVSELPVVARSKSRKEKNKLASRACRLKKKAQHEANKVKLFGLEKEHRNLMKVLAAIREDVYSHVRNPSTKVKVSLVAKLDNLMKANLTHMIAGHTADYVNNILAKVISGDASGGLDI